MAVPNVFSAGTLARSSEVNENFSYLNGRIDFLMLAGRSGTYEIGSVVTLWGMK